MKSIFLALLLLLPFTSVAIAGPFMEISLPAADAVAQAEQAPGLPTMGTVGIFIFIAVIAFFAMLILRRQER